AGRVSHALSAGSIVSAGELLAKLELKDPSKVKKILPFEGHWQGPGLEEAEDLEPREELLALLDGYSIDAKGPLVVQMLDEQKMFASFANNEVAAETVRGVLEKYLSNERPFAASIEKKQPYDQLLLELINEGKDDLQKVLFMLVAHNKMAERNGVIMAILREMVAAEGSGMSCMYVPEMREDDMDSAVHQKILEISQLPSTAGVAGDYGNVLLDVLPTESHAQRLRGLREQLVQLDEKAFQLAGSELPGASEGNLEVELLVEALHDEDLKVQKRAMHSYLYWLAKPGRLAKLEVQEKSALWTQFFPVDTEVHNRHGLMLVLPDLEHMEGALDQRLPELEALGGGAVPLNFLHVVVGRDAFPAVTDRTLFYNTDAELKKVLQQSQEVFAKKAQLLKLAGVGEICLVLPQPPRHPRFARFMLDEMEEWSEQEIGRDMWPSFQGMLELGSLKRIYQLQRIHKEVRPTSHIYLATQPSLGGKAPAPELLMRALYLSKINPESLSSNLSDSLDMALDEIEHALLDPQVSKFGPTITSRIFLHLVAELDMPKAQIQQLFMDTISSHVGHRGSDIIKLYVDQIEVKVHVRDNSCLEILRFSFSSLHGGFFKPKLLREIPDPVTGFPLRWEDHSDGVVDQSSSQSYQAKRVAARRAGSSYAYDLPGMLQLALRMKWISAPEESRAKGSQATGTRRRSPSPRGRTVPSKVENMPKDVLKAKELVMDWSKMELIETERLEGSNDVGMLAWRLTMQTPEYPEGRDVILISNDVTFQAGSFGVREDRFFQKASEFARDRGLPRIYVSCNSGARVGLVEELKPLFKVKWLDPSDCNKGFEYLYMLKHDYEKLPAGSVEAHKVEEAGEERYVLDAIIGEGMKSTEGGIGVENLQGSGLIAGETSKAYQETFTLSYITGRSVGIGAYLNRLGQRNIQMVSSPMILTGYAALNKLLGKNVYSSQDQLGGPQIMVPNGVTHQVVRDDQEGMSAILDWLSFVPKDVSCPPPICSSSDPWDRDVEFEPSPLPYDPRDFLRGVIDYEGRRLRGFFDAGSFTEYLEGWGQTVVVGRARLGGIPMGVIAVETRAVERLDWSKMELIETERLEGSNDVGMLAWRLTMQTPEYPEGRDVILISNDVTFQAGSFGVREDRFFQKASEFARDRGLPRIYVSCNSGARVGLVEELKPLFNVKWLDPSDCNKGFEYLYLLKHDYEKLPAGSVEAHKVEEAGEERYVLDAIIGEGMKSTEGGIGVENLQGSGLIAGETSKAYQETFTLSYITGRSVGIGAYLNRLGQRNIQMVSSPMILTGYSALNKLLGKNVYSSQDQLGGPQIMVPNGVTHQVVRDDQEGMSAILDWLSFVPKDVSCPPPISSSSDPWDRDVEFEPSPLPYDPRDFLRGVIDYEGRRLRGFFDAGSFTEYLEGWGQTVVVGRARLGGIPMGVIAVETRAVERLVPADPSNPESREMKETMGGKVWFPDSAFKTAQALKDFNHGENLPVMIFANWRGFSGGTRDMYNEILKFGAMIVDALVEYQHPIFIYIPKHGELRGGAWVVIDPAINPEKMEMYADLDSRGGILEPPGIVEVKFRTHQQVEAMHRLDPKLQKMDADLESLSDEAKPSLEKEIKAREKQLLPLYTSVATTFADLHDRAGRMKAKGVIKEGISWKDSRRFFFWRVKRPSSTDKLPIIALNECGNVDGLRSGQIWPASSIICGIERVHGVAALLEAAGAMAPAWKAAQKAYIAYIGPVTFRGPDADDEQVESKLLTQGLLTMGNGSSSSMVVFSKKQKSLEQNATGGFESVIRMLGIVRDREVGLESLGCDSVLWVMSI
ncbi:Acetyl-CoA carboxylase (ACC) [Includes: Biotin carboxylase], partial [Durusdinium trenchii]